MKVYSPSIIEELIVSGSATISGGLTVEGTISASGLTGDIENAQTASYVELENVDGFDEYSGSVVTNFNTFSNSVNNNIFEIETNFNNYTSSTDGRLNSLEAESGSIRTEFSNFVTSSEVALTLDGANATVNGNLTVAGNLTVQGTESIFNTETLSVESNIVELNTAGAIKGGILVGDVTAPSQLSGSLLWDGTNDHWIAGVSGSEQRIVLSGEFNSYTSSADGRITNLESFSSSLDDTFATDAELASVAESFRFAFNSYTSSNDERVTDAELVSIDIRSALNAFTSSADDRILELESFSSSLDDTFATDAELGAATGSIISALNNATSSIISALNSYTSSTDNRIDELENFSSSLDATFATDIELGSATSSIISTFNDYTSSADNRISSLETESGSMRTDFNSYTSSADNRISSLEAESGSIRTDFSNYTSSADNRLSSLETESGSIRTAFNNFTGSSGVVSASAQFVTLEDPFTGSFTGSFIGDGAGLTGIAASLAISGSTGNDTVDLKTDALTFAGENGITTVVTDNTLTIAIPTGSVSSSGQIDHNATTNYVANQHIDHSTVNIDAGSGISGGGNITTSRTLTLDTGSAHFTAGIKTKLDTETVVSSSTQVISLLPNGTVSGSGQIDHNATTNYVANQHIDHSTVNISAGGGMSGGGDITTSRTLTLDTGSTHFTSGVKSKLDADLVVSGSELQVKTFLSLENVDNTADADKPLSTAQKEYVDEVAQGLKARTAARALVDSNLDATYDNGTNGSGSFLEANSNGAFPTTDGIDTALLNVVGIRLLIAGQTNKAHNGLYVVQTAGDGSTPWKIRRCVECDSSEEVPGSFVFIKDGTVYANTGWILLVENASTFTIGEDAINPTQFSGAGSFTAGDGLGQEGNVFSLDTGSVHFTSGVKGKLNADAVFSSSAQVDHNATTNYVSNQHIDHSTVNISAGSGLTGGGTIAASRTLTLDTGSAHFTSGVKTKLNADTVVSSSTQVASLLPTGTVSASSQVDHNTTTNYVANQHIDHTTVNISAGSGMSGGGTIAASRTLTLDTGSAHFTGGVKTKLNADTVVSSSAQVTTLLPAGTVSSSAQINHNTTTNYVANQHIDHTTVSISPGAGMSGGGTIAANRTLTLDTGSAHFTGGVKTKLNADGVVSGSGQIAINSTTGTLNVDKGGTGQTTYTNGQLLIGNTTGNTLAKATLTAGTGITVTNGAGSITIAAVNNGTVTSIATGNGITGGTITTTGTLGLTGQALALHNLATNGVIARTGAGTVAGRTITGTTNQVTVTNGDGVSGNPTLSLPQSINTAASVQFGSFGVGTAASGTTGEIRATNEITAFFSDARLKNFHGKIPFALSKVMSLSGYYFTENEVAKSLGYNNDKMQVGLSAQEVQAVLPEVVTEAPISDEYLTVRYEKLIPLLVEAIKEQQKQIEELKSKLDNK